MSLPSGYKIRVKSHLHTHWSEWFAGMNMAQDPNGETILSGILEDQAALHGVLMKIRDLGLVLVSVNQTSEPEDPENNHPDKIDL
jgi:hypothetical protein